jgi:hypothetical protein
MQNTERVHEGTKWRSWLNIDDHVLRPVHQGMKHATVIESHTFGLRDGME